MNSVDLGPSFTFEAKCMLPATVLFSLSIRLPQGVILYLQFIPRVILSLEKKPCNYNDANPPPYFDALRRHWKPHRAFTRLQFELCDHGRLIKPNGYNPDCCDDETRRTFSLVASLAMASNFSLYMPPEILTNSTFRPFFRAWRNASAPTDLRNLYNGGSGALVTIDYQKRLLSSMAKAQVTTAATGCPSNHPPPKYEEQSPPPRVSQKSTGSESTVAAPTPPNYRHYHKGHRSEEPCDVEGMHA